MRPIVFHFPDDKPLARTIVESSGAELGTLQWHRFPDGESLITLHGECANRDVIIVCTLNNADAKALPLYFFATTARELGARRVGLIAPYLAYMRQDARFHPGQSRSAYGYAEFISTTFDWLITVDPHLHRIDSLDAIFSIPTVTVSAMPAVSEWLRANVADPVLIGPDRESAQWTERAARELGCPCVVLDKVRHGDRHVEVSTPDPALIRGRTPILIDDIASSGQTMIEALKGLRTVGVRDVICVAVHGLFADGAEAGLREAGAARIVSTNTVPHASNAIDIGPSVASALERFMAR